MKIWQIKKKKKDLIKNLTKSNDLEYESRKFVKLNEEKYNLNSVGRGIKKYHIILKENYSMNYIMNVKIEINY